MFDVSAYQNQIETIEIKYVKINHLNSIFLSLIEIIDKNMLKTVAEKNNIPLLLQPTYIIVNIANKIAMSITL